MIHVYSKQGCVQCTFTKNMLDTEIKLPYEEIDVEQRPGAMQAIQDMGFTGLPVVTTPNGAWSGFSPDKLRALNVPRAG